jgi:3-oxoacyl-[acyl-carrier protein] reductase
MSGFEGVSALVTGGSRGIGMAIAKALAASGAKVTLMDVLADDPEAVLEATGHPGRCCFVEGDVTSADDAKAAVDAAVGHAGGLDVLVNNAGITRDQLLMRMKDADWDQVMDVNLKGTYLMTKAASRRLMKSSRGRLINVASVVGLMGNAGQSNYAASKAGMVGFTKSIARELAGRGVTANAVAPGFIETDMTASLPEGAAEQLQAQIPLGRLGTVEDVASVVVFLASSEAAYVTGQVIPVDGGMVM